MEFKSNGQNIKIIQYPTNGDGCTLQIDNYKPRKYNKKYLRKLYESRESNNIK